MTCCRNSAGAPARRSPKPPAPHAGKPPSDQGLSGSWGMAITLEILGLTFAGALPPSRRREPPDVVGGSLSGGALIAHRRVVIWVLLNRHSEIAKLGARAALRRGVGDRSIVSVFCASVFDLRRLSVRREHDVSDGSLHRIAALRPHEDAPKRNQSRDEGGQRNGTATLPSFLG